MRIVGVIDLKEGAAVHATGGDRRGYAPATAVSGIRIDGDAGALARSYIDDFGIDEVYIADLDAIAGNDAAEPTIARIASLGVNVWLDAGLSSPGRARQALTLGATVAVIGLETLPSFDVLAAIAADLGGPHTALSLDVRHGVPVVSANWSSDVLDTPAMARRAVECGVTSIITMDLSRVGGRGIDLPLVGRIRKAVPDAALFAAGGVRDAADLRQLATAGCDGVLLATAIQRGAISRADIAAAHGYGSARR